MPTAIRRLLRTVLRCERCHGPGSLHIEGKAKMVNPATLAPARRDDVCAQCHLTGQSRVGRAGRDLADYRPGDVLSDFAAYFVATGAGDFQVNSHVEKLEESTCKRQAGDRMWCGTCHDPHTVPPPSERAAWFRAKCLTCHEAAQCARGFDCTGCHMPKSRAADAGHGVFTDHSIPRVPGRARARPAASWNLRGFSAADAGDRELGLAYAEIGVRTSNRRQQAEAIRLLTCRAAGCRGTGSARRPAGTCGQLRPRPGTLPCSLAPRPECGGRAGQPRTSVRFQRSAR